MDETKYTSLISRCSLVEPTTRHTYSGEQDLQEAGSRRFINLRTHLEQAGIEQASPISTTNQSSLNLLEKLLSKLRWKYLWVKLALYYRGLHIPGLHHPEEPAVTLRVEEREHDLHQLGRGVDPASSKRHSMKASGAFKLNDSPGWIFPEVFGPSSDRPAPCRSNSRRGL